ncbi:MAG: hypothetical protein WBV82_09020 [Myxococcaceae bacterium]
MTTRESPPTHAEKMERRIADLNGMKVGVTTYAIGSSFSCRIDNIDPGSVIGRGVGMTRELAEQSAFKDISARHALSNAHTNLKKATEMLQAVTQPKKDQES